MRLLSTALCVCLHVTPAAARGPAPHLSASTAFAERPAATRLRASFYGSGHGERLARHTANGEVFNPYGLTAAHRTLPFGTRLRVTFEGRSVVVRVNDRGPAAYTGRALDLSYGAARVIGLIRPGSGPVEIAILN